MCNQYADSIVHLHNDYMLTVQVLCIMAEHGKNANKKYFAIKKHGVRASIVTINR